MNNYADTLIEQFADKELADAHVDDFLNINIATQIKVLREQRKITQARLAELAGMEQPRISVMEDINYSSWSISILKKLASALDVSLKVSFEAYDTLIADTGNFSEESLRRDPRTESLKKLKRLKQVRDKINSFRASPKEASGFGGSVNMSCQASKASESKTRSTARSQAA